MRRMSNFLLALMATVVSATNLLQDNQNKPFLSNETALKEKFHPNNENATDYTTNRRFPELKFELMGRHNTLESRVDENLKQTQNRMDQHGSPKITNKGGRGRHRWKEHSSWDDDSRSWERIRSDSRSFEQIRSDSRSWEQIRSDSRSRERFRSDSRGRERHWRRPRHSRHHWHKRPRRRCEECPPGWEDQRIRFGKCYREYCHGTCNFNNAILTCKTVGVRGSRLVEPNLQNGELNYLFKFVRVKAKLWWLAIKRINNNLQYIESGRVVADSVVPWAKGEPTKTKQKCLALRKGGNQRVNDEPCGDAWGFAICEVRRRACRQPFG